jgi:hypothetical protein
MKEDTRSSHSRWRSDIVKSMGRSSLFLQIFGGTVVPSMQVRKRKIRANCRSIVTVAHIAGARA